MRHLVFRITIESSATGAIPPIYYLLAPFPGGSYRFSVTGTNRYAYELLVVITSNVIVERVTLKSPFSSASPSSRFVSESQAVPILRLGDNDGDKIGDGRGWPS